ncbi:hypothetical protein [Rhodospirillum centenum]|uniref:Uncharacterized protein n=1 Tax=Rhodospirillum centenum (strain ATCC 51521 / SW) TaxID=414684 RepID=B6ITG9_RHOCS|nr:hypothetical protein RC1_1790 [Rhodospirillum centenum SW]
MLDQALNKAQLVGRVRHSFELHSFHGDQWLVVKDATDLRQIEPAAALLVQRNEVEGVRVVRRTDYVDHDFSTTVTIVKRMRAGVQETDPLLRANPGRDASWCESPEDLGGDPQRQVFRGLLAKYLDERRLTPLEILYYEVHAKTLDQAGTTVQGALQRLASTQVRGTKQTAVARVKELLAIVEEGLGRLQKEAKAGPPLRLGPPTLAEVGRQLRGRPGDPHPPLYRAVAAHLADSKSWVEKLDRLFRLWTPDLTVVEMRVVDSLAAEILASPLALRELAGAERPRFELVLNAVDLYVGNLALAASSSLPPGVQALSRLLAQGALPRTMAELRLGLLRHLHARQPLRAGIGIRDEIAASVEILGYIRRKAPTLARDEEVLEALATRVDRLIQPEAMADLLGQSRTCTGRIDLVLGLMEQAPGEAPKAKLAPYLRSLLVPEDIIRETGGLHSRGEAMMPLATIASRVAGIGLPAGPRRELLELIDTALHDLIRKEVIGNSSVPYADRILGLVRLGPCLPAEGKARQIASELLTQALHRPEFILRYLERFPGPQERKDALQKLCALLAESGLVPAALIPNALA